MRGWRFDPGKDLKTIIEALSGGLFGSLKQEKDKREYMSAGARTERVFCNGASANSGITTPIFGARFHGPVFYLGPTPEENAPIQVGTPGSLVSPFHGVAQFSADQAKDLPLRALGRSATLGL
jgi:hypothetical protein